MNSQLLTSHANMLEQVKNEFKAEKNLGDNVVTTLDVNLQQVAYDALGSYDGAVVVMEPDTGKILAMVSKPDFNPNTISQDWDSLVADEDNSSLVNRAAQGLYPPGSTFKIVTSLAYWRRVFSGDRESFEHESYGEEAALPVEMEDSFRDSADGVPRNGSGDGDILPSGPYDSARELAGSSGEHCGIGAGVRYVDPAPEMLYAG